MRGEGPDTGRWLLLIHQIPPKPDYLRVKIWRRLQRVGAVPIKSSVYVLPRSDRAHEDFQWIVGEIVARLTLVMDRVGGETLRQRLGREPPLDPPTRRRYAEDLLGALDHLEQKGVTHKDIKPDNLLVGDGGLTLIDFSLASMPSDAPYGGTALYRDPSRADWTHGTDRYAAALCLFELYAGRHAFDGKVPECVDSADNDHDGSLDCADPDCLASPLGFAGTAPFPIDIYTLAAFDLESDLVDASGKGNDAIYLGGTFSGGALEFLEDPSGFDWSAHAALLAHPFTVEMVILTANVDDYQKLFGFDDHNDNGWYISGGQVISYLDGDIAAGALTANANHYLAFVSASDSSMNVYVDGDLLGKAIPPTFTAPPNAAIFFRDDSVSGRGEVLQGFVDAVRISSTARTGTEIADHWQLLQQ